MLFNKDLIDKVTRDMISDYFNADKQMHSIPLIQRKNKVLVMEDNGVVRIKYTNNRKEKLVYFSNFFKYVNQNIGEEIFTKAYDVNKIIRKIFISDKYFHTRQYVITDFYYDILDKLELNESIEKYSIVDLEAVLHDAPNLSISKLKYIKKNDIDKIMKLPTGQYVPSKSDSHLFQDREGVYKVQTSEKL